MAYSGAWRRSQRTTPAVQGNPNLGGGVDDRHAGTTEWDNPFAEPTPALPSLPEYLYAVDDYMPPPVFVYEPIIREPLGHDAGGVDRQDQDQGAMDPGAYAAHMADRGAAAVHHHGELIERADRDRYITQRVEMEFPQTGSRMALVRGRNAWPENNPEGPPPQGAAVYRWIDRQFTRRGIRTDVQPLRPYVAGNARQVPAPTDANGNPYTSPFPALGLARLRRLTVPQVRRVPRPPDADAITDGTADAQYDAPAYWQDW